MKNVREHAMRKSSICLFVSLIVLGFFFACAAGTVSYGSPDSGVLLRWHLDAGSVNEYDFNSDSVQNIEMMGNVMEQSTTIKSKIRHKIAEVSEAQITHDFSYAALDITSSSMQGETSVDTRKLIGESMLVSTLDTGMDLKLITKDFPASESGMPLEMTFMSIIAEFPEQRVKIQDTWNAKQNLRIDKGTTFSEGNSDNNYTLAGFENKMGFECAKILIKSEISMSAAIEQQGMVIDMQGELTADGTIYFAYNEGMIVEYVSESTGDIVGTIASMGMTFPVTVEEKSVFTLLQ